jgi:hypothetical protein
LGPKLTSLVFGNPASENRLILRNVIGSEATFIVCGNSLQVSI